MRGGAKTWRFFLPDKGGGGRRLFPAATTSQVSQGVYAAPGAAGTARVDGSQGESVPASWGRGHVSRPDASCDKHEAVAGRADFAPGARPRRRPPHTVPPP